MCVEWTSTTSSAKRHWSTETGQLSRRRKNQSEVFWKVVQRIRGYIVVKRTKRLVFYSILFLRISSAIVPFRIWDLLESCPCKTPSILTIPSYPVGAGIAQCWKHDTALRCFSLGALVVSIFSSPKQEISLKVTASLNLIWFDLNWWLHF